MHLRFFLQIRMLHQRVAISLNLLQNNGMEILIELSVIVDAGKPFVKACYDLEGDEPLAPVCYEMLSSVRASMQVKHWPNTHPVAQKLASEFQNPTLEPQLLSHALACVQPAQVVE